MLAWIVAEAPEAAWLTLSNTSGSSGDKVTASVNISGLSAGEYQTIVRISDSNATNSPVDVPLRLTVEPEPVEEFPEIAVSPVDLKFSAIENGSPPATQKITVTNSGGGTLSWSAIESPEVGWMSLTNTSGGDGEQVEVSVDITDLAVGTYSGTVRISDPNAVNDPVDVPVTLTISTQTSSGDILAEFEAETSPSLPNSGWQITRNEGADCIMALVKSRTVADPQYQLDYTFEVPAGVNVVYVFAEVDINASGSDDSFWISMNNQDICAWKDLEYLGDEWKRAWIYDYGFDTQHAFRVSTGANTLNVYPRVDDAFINWFVITTNPNFDFQNYIFGGGLAKEFANEKSAEIAVVPSDFQLLNNFPNPFNSTTQIAIDLPEECRCSIIIYNSLGQQVRTIFHGTLPAGRHQIAWNGKNDFEQPIMSGLYFCLFKSAKWNQTIKMILLE